MSKEVDLTHIQKPVPCDACEDEVPGTYYCIPCKKTLCEDCEKSHYTSTDDHKVILRSQVGEIDPSIPICGDHGDDACFHCEKCNVPICIKCVIGNHQGHKRTYLNVLMEKKKLLQSNIDEIQSIFIPELVRQEEANKTERENYNKKIDQLTKDIEDANKLIHQILDRIHKDRLKSIKDTQLNQLTLFDGLAEEIRMTKDLCKSKVSEYQDALEKNQIQAINDLLARKNTLPEVQRKAEVLEFPSFEPPNINSIVESLGKLQILSHSVMQNPIVISKFRSPLKGHPQIFTTKEGHVWLGGDKAKELLMVDMHGKILKKRKVQTLPHMLAGMDGGDVIIIPHIDQHTPVKRLLSDGREQHLLDQSYQSLAISITAGQKLLICTVDGRVLKTNSDGKIVEQIYKGTGKHSANHAVENAYGNIYITDETIPGVVRISKGGHVLTKIIHTTRGKKLLLPVGLVIDKFGNILCADMDGHCVYVIDQNQQMRELVGRSRGIQHPTLLAIDKQNNLWVTQTDGSIVVVKYIS